MTQHSQGTLDVQQITKPKFAFNYGLKIEADIDISKLIIEIDSCFLCLVQEV